jgi:hypothetical protein
MTKEKKKELLDQALNADFKMPINRNLLVGIAFDDMSDKELSDYLKAKRIEIEARNGTYTKLIDQLDIAIGNIEDNK